MNRDLSPFFAPKNIAVVGAGERATSSGGAIMQMLRQAGYGGRVVPVNPKGGAIFGYESVTSITAIDPPVDPAVIVIRPDAILDAVREAADRGITNLLILPGGFAEAGPIGVQRNEDLIKLAAARGLTVAGPNCAGIIHLDPAWRFAATFPRDLPPGAAAGASNGLAFISQSARSPRRSSTRPMRAACRSRRSCRSATRSISASKTTSPGWASGRRSAPPCSTSNRSRITNASAAWRAP